MMRKRPQVGVACLIVRNGKILLGKRKGSHGAGTWSTPGGHLELGEGFGSAIRRELLEQTGMKMRYYKQFCVTNDYFAEEQKHYVSLFFIVVATGTPELLEPDKCEEWKWFYVDDLPAPLFLPMRTLESSGKLRGLK